MMAKKPCPGRDLTDEEIDAMTTRLDSVADAVILNPHECNVYRVLRRLALTCVEACESMDREWMRQEAEKN